MRANNSAWLAKASGMGVADYAICKVSNRNSALPMNFCDTDANQD
jgi:hypothetical protein